MCAYICVCVCTYKLNVSHVMLLYSIILCYYTLGEYVLSSHEPWKHSALDKMWVWVACLRSSPGTGNERTGRTEGGKMKEGERWRANANEYSTIWVAAEDTTSWTHCVEGEKVQMMVHIQSPSTWRLRQETASLKLPWTIWWGPRLGYNRSLYFKQQDKRSQKVS